MTERHEITPADYHNALVAARALLERTEDVCNCDPEDLAHDAILLMHDDHSTRLEKTDWVIHWVAEAFQDVQRKYGKKRRNIRNRD